MTRRIIAGFALGLLLAVLCGCAAPRLTLFGDSGARTAPGLGGSGAATAPAKPVCTPEMATPPAPVPLATDSAYHGFLLVAPQTDAEKAGFDVARVYFGDLLLNAQTAHDRLARAAAYCAGAKP